MMAHNTLTSPPAVDVRYTAVWHSLTECNPLGNHKRMEADVRQLCLTHFNIRALIEGTPPRKRLAWRKITHPEYGECERAYVDSRAGYYYLLTVKVEQI